MWYTSLVEYQKAHVSHETELQILYIMIKLQ